MPVTEQHLRLGVLNEQQQVGTRRWCSTMHDRDFRMLYSIHGNDFATCANNLEICINTLHSRISSLGMRANTLDTRIDTLG